MTATGTEFSTAQALCEDLKLLFKIQLRHRLWEPSADLLEIEWTASSQSPWPE